MNSKIIRFFLPGLVLLLGFPLVSHAHLSGGEDRLFEEVIIDFGYDPAPLTTTETSVFAINIIDSHTKVPSPPTYVWVRLSHGDTVVFSGVLAPEADHFVFSHLFFQPGQYEFLVRFDHGGVRYEEVFPIVIEGTDVGIPQKSDCLLVAALTGATVLFLCAIGILRQRKNKK